MNPLTTSAFDLPDRLSAKADPTLIAHDERHFADIADCLEQTIAEFTDLRWLTIEDPNQHYPF